MAFLPWAVLGAMALFAKWADSAASRISLLPPEDESVPAVFPDGEMRQREEASR